MLKMMGGGPDDMAPTITPATTWQDTTTLATITRGTRSTSLTSTAITTARPATIDTSLKPSTAAGSVPVAPQPEGQDMTKLDSGQNPDAKALAQNIVTAQKAEITDMNQLLGK